MLSNKIGIIDYGAGNVNSVINMLDYVGIDSSLILTANEIHDYNKLIIPGVGKFDFAMKNLDSLGFSNEIKRFAKDKSKKILGICLGAQLLLERSDEGLKDGLGLIKGKSIKFKTSNSFPIPHMGWNTLKPEINHPVLENICENDRFYFVHSYHLTTPKKNILTKTKYNIEFTSSIYSDNIFGFQFHPEKSLKFGIKLLKNFYNLDV